MALRKFVPSVKAPSVGTKPLNFSIKMPEGNRFGDSEGGVLAEPERDVDIDLREVYFLIMHFLSSGPCLRTCGQLWNELLEHHLLPRRYHAWYSRSGICSGDENDDGLSFPLNYNMLAVRYSHIEKDHLLKLLKELVLSTAPPSRGLNGGNAPNAADVPTLVGKGSFSLLSHDREIIDKSRKPPSYMRWPHIKADQFHGLCLREIGGGFSRHHRAPSIRASCYAIAKPSTMVQKMQNIKRLRGHRNAVYCATFDRSGRYVITGSDDRLVKIWSMEIAFCLASCRGHEGDITDLAVSSNNAVVASSSNDCIIRVWRLPDGQPISILRGHTGAVTAIAFSPRPGFVFQLLSSSDDGTCRIWDARNSQMTPRVYAPRPLEAAAGRNTGPSTGAGAQNHQIFCCTFNSSGTVFVTGSSDTLARVWSAHKSGPDDSDQLNHEIDVLSGHENDVNYVQFSSCAIASRFITADTSKEENVPKFKNSWFTHDNIVTCSRDGSAIIWIPRSRRSQAKACRWTRAYHLKVPPPPMPPQPLRGGPRQRILPTPRGVNMITWSLDNRFVLAAIMDCRICVWNASDGSLVHSLTGHTESTYVLDVHPYNPRIAMSAGYDGRTIVWDIWEGIPIQIYETSRFKLVDGKFSPDGTSIILSDDVGQLYILSTGQGESQKDAKYDQFFLGDYRPLVHDTHGNVLDQETQIPAYRRNMQDLLCDSGMIPYPEPYQSAYQKRRLGALGVDWNPSSLTLAIGPDFTLDPDFQMLPLADLDLLTEPLPELPDAMDWEPVIEIHSDDNDSEYNVPEEYLSGAEQGSLSSSSSDDSKGSEEDGETEDSVRRSKRKKKKADVEITTSSGRRVKRRNLDETEENQLGNNSRKPKSSRKKTTRKKKSLKSESLRPQRAAALNALNLFSKITGTTSTDEEDEEEGSEVETSDSDSNIESDRSDEDVQDELLRKHSKGKEVSVDESEDLFKPELQMSGRNRERLVLRLPNKHLVRERDMLTCEYRDDEVGTSSKVPQESNENRELEEVQVDDAGHLCLTRGYKDGKISWGGVRARSTKRLRLGEGTAHNAFSRTNSCFESNFKQDTNNLSDNSNTKRDSPSKFTDLQTQTYKLDMNEEVVTEDIVTGDGTHSRANGVHLGSIEPKISESTSKSRVDDDDSGFASTRLDLKRTLGHPDSASEGQEMESASGNLENQKRSPSHDVPLSTKEEDMISKVDINNGDGSLMESDTQQEEKMSVAKDPVEPHCDSKNRRFTAVYRRTRPHKGTSNAGKQNQSVDSLEGTIDELSRSKDDVANNKNPEQGVDSEKKLGNTPVSRSPLLNEKLGSSSRVTVGLRSTRSRRGSYLVREPSPVDLRRSRKSSRNATWLMLSNHEEGSRYIPQLGDEIAYLRQGHQEYLEQNRGRETPPWTSVRGKVRDVEYCKVQKLDYSSLPGSGESCCKMTLEFVDPTSAVHLQSFKITLPEMTGFPDFLVERSRYDASMQRNWTFRDKCRVWWKNDGEEDGSWWFGRILAVKPKSFDFPDSPWERYAVQYKSEPTETHFHSSWELFDVDALWEHRHIDAASKLNLRLAFEKLDKSCKLPQDRYGVNQLKQLSQKSNYTNRFPVPISLELIESRLDNDYYRSLEAVKHDYEVMLSNAEQYLGNKPEFSAKLKRLYEWLTKTFSPS